MIYQPSLFAHINSIDTMHSNGKFWNTVTVKQLSSGQGIWIWFRWCWHWLGLQGKQLWIACHLYRYALCKRSQQLGTICTCVTDYTHKFDTHHRCKELLKQNGFSVLQPLVLCLRNAFETSIRQTIKRYYTLHTTDGMVYYSSHQSSIYWNNSSMHWNEIFNLLRCKVEWVLEAVSGFNNPFMYSFEDNEQYLLSLGCSC